MLKRPVTQRATKRVVSLRGVSLKTVARKIIKVYRWNFQMIYNIENADHLLIGYLLAQQIDRTKRQTSSSSKYNQLKAPVEKKKTKKFIHGPKATMTSVVNDHPIENFGASK